MGFWVKKKCSYVAQKVCCAFFSALWVTLPNQEPSFLTFALSYVHRCYFPAFLYACLFIECIAERLPRGDWTSVAELSSPSFHWNGEQQCSCLYNGWQSSAHAHTHSHTGSPPMRNHYGGKAVASLCKCNLALLHLAPSLNASFRDGWHLPLSFSFPLSVCRRLGGILVLIYSGHLQYH